MHDASKSLQRATDEGFPIFPLPKGTKPELMLHNLGMAGLQARLKKHPQRENLDQSVYWERLSYELNTIADIGLSNHILVVHDALEWARNKGIAIGSGHSSTASSLLLWALHITSIDPIAHNLLFERFACRNHCSLHISVELCKRRGGEVIHYLIEKYGQPYENYHRGYFTFHASNTITFIQDIQKLIAKSESNVLTMDTIPLDDATIYELFCRGELDCHNQDGLDGVFQMENRALRNYTRLVQPRNFEELAIPMTLHRASMRKAGIAGEFLKRKHGKVPITYPARILEDCLKPTYGLPIYKEQLVQIVQLVAQYSPWDSDLLFRALWMNSIEKREKFINAALKNGFTHEEAEEFFALITKYNEYAFMKSHAYSYALISYYTAYLKIYYPTEFKQVLYGFATYPTCGSGHLANLKKRCVEQNF